MKIQKIFLPQKTLLPQENFFEKDTIVSFSLKWSENLAKLKSKEGKCTLKYIFLKRIYLFKFRDHFV